MPESNSLTIFAISGAETRRAHVRYAGRRLTALDYLVTLDESTRLRCQRFAGDDEQRLATLMRVADSAPSVALASRGGYGMTRLLDAVDWKRIRRSVDRGTRWVGCSDLTAMSLALMAHEGRPSWHGPMASDDFGTETFVDEDHRKRNETTVSCFDEAMQGRLEAIGFQTDSRYDGVACRGTLWGGNLTMVCSLLGTRHWPKVRGGILFLEDVGEHPYRIERMLLQLSQCGVLQDQKAILLGSFTDYKPSPLDKGFKLSTVIEYLRRLTRVPILNGFPFGHTALKVTVPIGVKVEFAVEGRSALLGW